MKDRDMKDVKKLNAACPALTVSGFSPSCHVQFIDLKGRSIWDTVY